MFLHLEFAKALFHLWRTSSRVMMDVHEEENIIKEQRRDGLVDSNIAV